MTTCDVDVVVKFGGSAITKKDTFETLDIEGLNYAVDLIDCCHRNKLTCVIVHGAGSFGHHQAKEYKVNNGWTGMSENKIKHVKKGFYLTRQSVTKLHQTVLSALLDKDIPAVGLSACGIWKTLDGKVISHDLNPIVEIIKNGFIPLLHGDCIFDDNKGCSILSGDTIIQKMSESFNVKRIVFLTSVEGIFNKSPTECSDAVLIKHIHVDRNGLIVCDPDSEQNKNVCVKQGDEGTDNSTHRFHKGLESVTEDQKSELGSELGNEGRNDVDIETKLNDKDVTGGMLLKLQCAFDIVKINEGRTKVFVSQVGSDHSKAICLHGHCDQECNKCGTEILYSSDQMGT
ncbi:hypothetical protein ACF0H5_018413 [Mactra antiquata]